MMARNDCEALKRYMNPTFNASQDGTISKIADDLVSGEYAGSHTPNLFMK